MNAGGTGVEPGDHGSPTRRAKLRAPVRPSHFVERPRLTDLLDDLAERPVTAVVAPAGSGKSVLVADWLASTPTEGVWLSLDEHDRSPIPFWEVLLDALDDLTIPSMVPTRRLLDRRGPSAEVAAQLVDDLDGAREEPAVLVVDDAHVLGESCDPVEAFGWFLQHLPAWLHVIVLSRRDLDLPVDRLRAQGRLGEVRFDELCFSPAEASELLARIGPSLPDDGIEAMVAQVDGWVAGLQLAALAQRTMRARAPGDHDGGGPELLFDHFIWHEVLADEPDELVQLLLDVAVVERVNHDLADTLGGRGGASALLQQAEARGLFVTRLDRSGWFQIHRLVRTALLAELDRRSPDDRREQHARAAGWFESHGDVELALEHWLQAGRGREALRLLSDEHAQLYDSGREAVVQRTIDALDHSVATEDFDATLEYTWCNLLVSRQRFRQAVTRATEWAERTPVDDHGRGRLHTLQAIDAIMRTEWGRGAELATTAAGELGPRWSRDPIGRFAWNLVSRDIALSERWDDTGDEVRAVETAIGSDAPRMVALEGTRALGHALAGRPIDALRCAAGVRAALSSSLTILRTELAVAEAIAHHELGDDARALTELETAAAATAAPTMVYCTLLARVRLVEAHAGRGDLDAARTTFEAAEAFVADQSLGRGGQDWLARAGVALAIAEDDRPQAARWSASVGDPFWRAAAGAAVHLVDPDAEARDAFDALTVATPRSPRQGVVRDLLRARLTSDPEQATKLLGRAIETAAAHEMLQTVVSWTGEAGDIVDGEAWRAPEAWVDRLRRLAARRPGEDADPTGLIEPLTDRERQVLRFLSSRLTTREIAEELHVSINTVKFHLKVIYRKLGVSSRAEAVERARSMRPG